jgi:ABC-2 type transport system permease protein
MSDLWTMIWKESKELIFQAGWAQLVRALIVIGAVGIALPWRAGLPWLELLLPELLILLWVPFIYLVTFIGDAVAGERERHTLDTLLASRMPDHAILLGKIIVTVGYAWGMALVSLLLGPVVVNLSAGHGQGSWVFYHPLDVFLEAVALSLLVSLFAASAGVLISLRVATVRQAQQIISVGTIVLIFGGLLVISLLPANLFSSLSYAQVLLIAMAVLTILDAVLLGWALLSFQRSRLILS